MWRFSLSSSALVGLSACADGDPNGVDTEGTGDSSSTGTETGSSADAASDDGSGASADEGTSSASGTATGATTSDSGESTGDTDDGAPGCDGMGPAVDALGTTPGELDSPFPTLEHLTLHWRVEGDDDGDATVTVRYRPEGESTWRDALPLFAAPADAREGFAWEHRFAGSLFGLEPATTYEVELHLLDPDGGCEVRTLTATTRAIPAAMPGAPVIPATPETFADLLAAAVPGDVLELAAGTYAGFVVPTDGTADAPIVIRSQAPEARAVVDGEIRLDGRSHVIVEGLDVRAQIKFNDSRFIAIMGCTVQTAADGIVARTRSENHYIADNVVTGATVWSESAFGADGDNVGEGILVTGPGHVIEHNRVSGFRDCISFLEDAEAADQFSLDVLRNDLTRCADDGIEADFCFHDCRIVENLLVDTFIAMSSQPGLGGPTYFVRNVVYDTLLSAFKLQRGSVGDVGLHNTVVKQGDGFGIYTTDVFSRLYFRNNLFIGGPGGDVNGYSTGSGDVVSLEAAAADVDLDYDGYGSTLGTFTGTIGMASFSDLAEMQAVTTEAHAVEVDLSVFAASVDFPASPFPGFAPPDLRLAPGSTAVDAGIALPGIDDGFAGDAPDLGAHELGAEPPAYGPRG